MKCVRCGAEFEPVPNAWRRKYCSDKCRIRAYCERNHDAILKRQRERRRLRP